VTRPRDAIEQRVLVPVGQRLARRQAAVQVPGLLRTSSNFDIDLVVQHRGRATQVLHLEPGPPRNGISQYELQPANGFTATGTELTWAYSPQPWQKKSPNGNGHGR
jgi:hypothetical protein